jgi:hypothetical protein
MKKVLANIIPLYPSSCLLSLFLTLERFKLYNYKCGVLPPPPPSPLPLNAMKKLYDYAFLCINIILI